MTLAVKKSKRGNKGTSTKPSGRLNVNKTVNAAHGSTSVTYVPTDEDREHISLMASYGLPHETIAGVIRISLPTLYRHFRFDLDNAMHLKNTEVVKSLFLSATRDRNPASMIFWLKCRARWKSDDPPPAPPATRQLDFGKLTLEEHRVLEQLLSKATATETIQMSDPLPVRNGHKQLPAGSE